MDFKGIQQLWRLDCTCCHRSLQSCRKTNRGQCSVRTQAQPHGLQSRSAGGWCVMWSLPGHVFGSFDCVLSGLSLLRLALSFHQGCSALDFRMQTRGQLPCEFVYLTLVLNEGQCYTVSPHSFDKYTCCSLFLITWCLGAGIVMWNSGLNEKNVRTDLGCVAE